MDTQTSFSFSRALEALKEGQSVSRKGWNGKGMYLELQTPDYHSKMTLPYIYMAIPAGEANDPEKGCVTLYNLVPWLASQTDLLGNDWFIF